MLNLPGPALGAVLAGAAEVIVGLVLISSMGAADVALFFLVSGICTLALAAGLTALLRVEPDSDPPGRGGGSDPEPPEWWPDFERDFGRYLRERSPTRT